MWSTPYQAPTHPLPTAQTVVPTASAAVSGGTSTDPSKPKPKRKRIRIKTERRRQQCRTNQARYRQKQTERAKTLEMSVKQLKQEIPLLETQRSRLLSIAKPSAVDIADEYFRLFSHGVRDSQHSTGMSSGPQQWLQDSETQHQLDFLRSSMAADVALGDLRGVEELVDQWRRYSTFFKELYFERESMIETSAQSVLAVATLTVTVSEATFQDVFPHLSDEGQDGRAAALRSRLLGQRLFLPCSVSFEMDETCHSVERIDMSVDFLMPLAHGLGSMEDASFVLAEAYITPDGIIGNSKE
ncbi:hypothetical protein PHYBOEH_010075 [Phytophthora boehmeriae]|uniref:BZIP domain-containing protein n=1 Tax=Phytophthora boehmeriae TaxID=109152 RepID=A0A8T1VPA6_9STRA|nr:hypothetical protein PHYBOEH_010075 [Phytophthora boehmeriae]